MSNPILLTRRSLLAAGGLLLSLGLPSIASANPQNAVAAATGDGDFGGFLHIATDGTVTFVAPTAEIGQGAYTAGAQIIAEELGCLYDRIRIVSAPADEVLYVNPLMGMQLTGASSGIRGFFDPLRRAGASARIRLIAAAAKLWDVETDGCDTDNGNVVHAASGRRASFGDLAAAAARVPEPDPTSLILKDPRKYRVIGQSVLRVDVRGKSNGTALYGIDIVRPGMKIAAVSSSPMIGGHLVSVNPAPALAVDGVIDVISLPSAVAVLAEHSWAAIKGLSKLEPVWGGGDENLSDARLDQDLREAAHTKKPVFSQSEGDVETAMRNAHKTLEMDYSLPFLSHAQMEPLNAVVEFSADGCDIWLGTQAPPRVQAAAAAASGLPAEKIRVHNQLSGGGFGRRSEADYIPVAVQLAQKAGVPVKMLWTREQDMRGGLFRPILQHHMRVGLAAEGKPVGWSHRIAGGSVFANFLPALAAQGIPDSNAIEGASELIYDVGSTNLDYVRHDPPLPITWWRSVGPGHNMFVVEGVINEIAQEAGFDPVEFRRSLMPRDSRARHVLDLAAEKAHWGTPLPPRTGRGIAVQHAFGSYLACVMEAFVTDGGDIRLKRVVVALDCGQVINPRNVIGQVEGAVLFGLSAALWGQINVDKGRVVQDNFNSYRVIRINETPPIETYLVPSLEPPEGVGEAGTSIAFPALAAAIFGATGKRLRSLPFNRHSDLIAKA